MKISNLLLDLGNVLVINHPERAAKEFSRLNKLNLAENMEIMADDIDYMEGKISPSQFARRHIRAKNLPISEQEFHDIYVDIFALNVPLFNLLKKLKSRITLTMLSNTEMTTIEFLKKKFPQLFSLFDGRLALSFLEEVRAVKPKKKIYQYALKVSGSRPGTAAFFDDKMEYVEAARKLGIPAYRYTTIQKFQDDLLSLGLRPGQQ